jgi:DNA modification methylase
MAIRRHPESRKMKIAELTPAPYNPRQISKSAMKGLTASIERFGLVQPVIWNRRTEHVVGGHQRLKVLQEQGIEETEVIVVDLPKSEEKALNVALNSPAISGEFTADLDSLLAEIQADMPQVFDDLMLDELWTGVFEEADGKTDPDAVPETPEEAVSVPGALYRLGRHRLLCGDATNIADVERLLGGHSAALFATDPPYLVDYTGADRPHDSGKDWADTFKEREIEDPEGFFRATFENALEVCRENAAWYCWHASKRSSLVEAIWADLGVLYHEQIIWVKPVATHGFSVWPWRHEPCLMGWRKGNRPYHDGDYTHKSTSVWEVDWEGKRRIVGNEHPTQKPVEVFTRPMRKHTKPGEVCYEPFAGSGSQVIAAEKAGRRCFALEIEPVFCDVVRRRWAEFVEGEGCDWQAVTSSTR